MMPKWITAPENINMRRLLLLLSVGLLVALTSPVIARPQPKKLPLVLKTDTGHIQLRSYDTSSINSYRTQAEFQYHEDVPQDTWWDKFWRWFWSLFKPVKASRHNMSAFLTGLKYLFIVLGISAIAFIILRVMGVDIATLFRRKPKEVAMPYTENFENIHEIDFDTELENVLAQHNYRLAIRLLYLKCLKQLNDASLINWQLNKTNSAYISELQNNERRNEFSRLTRQFEYVWYGEFAVDAQVYQNINALFVNFKKSIA
jgi:hypothetical protein